MVIRFRQEDLKSTFDLIIIGGGINGCGIARDASERGLKVLLLEKEDFGAGCTSASTRLIHGGLRYLEHFEFGLVRESLREREILLKNAGHLVRPLEFCLPIYANDKRNYWTVKAGMFLYDIFSFGKSLPNHKMMSAGEFIKYESAIKTKDLAGAAIFFDCHSMFPERICLENILMAKQNKALVLNHACVVEINLENKGINNIGFIDTLTGRRHLAYGKEVVNVSGPWVDLLCSLTSKNIKRKIGGTKGSHIVIKKFDSGPKHAMLAFAKSDSRPFFIIPWQEYYLIGTTDIPYEGNLDALKADDSEINYLISETNKILSSKEITRGDVLFSYSGIRPLPYSPNVNAGNISRKHIIFDHKEEGINNLISIIGGKLTTYRNLSEEVVDLIIKKLNYDFIPSKTKTTPFVGSVGADIDAFKKLQLKKIKKKYDLDDDIIFHLIDLYGSRYKNVLDLTLKNKDLGRLLSSHSLDIRAQVVFAIQNELAYTVSDILLRRVTLGLNEGLGKDAVLEVGRELQILLNYSQEEIRKQINDYEEKVLKVRLV